LEAAKMGFWGFAGLIVIFFICKLIFTYMNIVIIGFAIEKIIKKGAKNIGKNMGMPDMQANARPEGKSNARKQRGMQEDSTAEGEQRQTEAG
jgi:hypothetical protein